VKRGGTKKKSKIAPLKKSCKQRRKNIKKHCDERNSKKKHQAYQFILFWANVTKQMVVTKQTASTTTKN
jgi:hypothetical protein